MPDLPYDIIVLIVRFLAVGKWLIRYPVARYSTINHLWNEAIEREWTFKEILVRSSAINSITIARLGRVLQRDGGRRRKYVRHIIFTPESVNRLMSAKTRSANERTADDVVFSRDIAELWGILADWSPESKFKLSISLHGRGRANWPDSNGFLNYIGDSLPLLSNVHSFETGLHVRIWPPSVVQFLNSLPAVKTADIEIGDVCASRWARESNVTEIDEVLATSIRQIPPGCTNVQLNLGHSPHGRPGVSDAFLCAGLTALSPQLRKLYLTGSAVTPAVLDAVASMPWPHLQEVKFDFDAVRKVTGRADAAFVNALYVATASVVRSMPALLELMLCSSCILKEGNAPDLNVKRDEKTNKWKVEWGVSRAPFRDLDDKVTEAWGIKKPADKIQWRRDEEQPEDETPSWYAEELLPWKY
ncbi:uncharacterized protein K452DRAFT_339950 [Aplosporella prunicola CBS 121167]|uniref:F-box domain-containing protein n=1 Tax=Aplosporella prunicola CBS 121167 TaxID=1176127 RepID=A0A6A6B4V8_9PEZI|nr:uncharacterized protein K452DRAFT_339950 [Aplosporella prunicola CBS 121167]KAF2137791.1 hypothetical protein K452DRAFT_339950 [Aplosporella prunicola CBS 121167]